VTTEPVETEEATLARFDPMLRALVTFGLVEPERAGSNGDGGHHWRLNPAVERRLDSLVPPAPPVEKLIYFGHRCGACGEHGPTRLRGGAYLCEACREPTAERSPRR
jgi:hypothetical protein